MTPIRETIARAIYASFAGGTSDETLDDMATAIAQSGADAVLRALDEAGLVVVKKEPPAAVEAITGDAWGAVYELGRTSERIGGGAAHITEDEARRMARAAIDAAVVE